jgi:hypothetical protein
MDRQRSCAIAGALPLTPEDRRSRQPHAIATVVAFCQEVRDFTTPATISFFDALHYKCNMCCANQTPWDAIERMG